MTGSRKMLGGAFLFAGAALLSSPVAAADVASYQPAQGLSHVFGSKHAVGYFLQKDGACALNVFVAENSGEEAGTSASWLKVKVLPGEGLKLTSVEGQTIEIKCGANASTLEVKAESVSSKYVSR